jgi:hypothetical protein
LLSVAKTNVWLSRGKLYTGNIDDLFGMFSIYFLYILKSAPTEVSAPKNANSKLSPNELIRR